MMSYGYDLLVLGCMVCWSHAWSPTTLECTSHEVLKERDHEHEPWRSVNTEKHTCRAKWCIYIEGVGTVNRGTRQRQTSGRMYGCSNEHVNSLCEKMGPTGGCGRTDNLFDVLTGDFRLCCCNTGDHCVNNIQSKFDHARIIEQRNAQKGQKHIEDDLMMDLDVFEEADPLQLEQIQNSARMVEMTFMRLLLLVGLGFCAIWIY